MLGSERAVRTPKEACVQARLPKAGLGAVLEMRGAISMQSACVQARLPKAGLGAVLERPVEGGRVVVGDVREPQVRCEHERLMRGAIRTQSACNQHAISMQSGREPQVRCERERLSVELPRGCELEGGCERRRQSLEQLAGRQGVRAIERSDRHKERSVHDGDAPVGKRERRGEQVHAGRARADRLQERAPYSRRRRTRAAT